LLRRRLTKKKTYQIIHKTPIIIIRQHFNRNNNNSNTMSSYIQIIGDKSDTILPIVDHADTSSLDIDGSNDDVINIVDNINNNDNNNDSIDNAVPPQSTTTCTKLLLIELFCCFIPVPIGVGLEFIFNPYKRPIPYQILNDSSGEYILNQMYNLKNPTNETVSSLVMFFCAMLLPFCLQLLIICLHNRNNNKTSSGGSGSAAAMNANNHQQQQNNNNNNNVSSESSSSSSSSWIMNDEIHKTICVYFMSIGLTQSLTNICKLYCGYLRPIFYDMCQPNDTYEQCQSSSHERQSRVSFISGHASLSVCGLLLLSFYLERLYGVSSYNNNNNNNNNTTRRRLPIQLVRLVSIGCYAPMLLAFFICKFFCYVLFLFCYSYALLSGFSLFRYYISQLLLLFYSYIFSLLKPYLVFMTTFIIQLMLLVEHYSVDRLQHLCLVLGTLYKNSNLTEGSVHS
jgi:membrane-associated phospholipid phosphatase